MRSSRPSHRQSWLLILALAAACGGGGGGGGEPPQTVGPPDPPEQLNPPTLTGVWPTSGPREGGTTIALIGTELDTGELSVTIGGVPATDVFVGEDGSATCVTPEGKTGLADVHITTVAGSASIVGAFLYVSPAPTLESIAPVVGTGLGGTPLVVTGTGFDYDPVDVWVGTVAARDVVIVDSQTVHCVTPPGPIGETVDVRVTTDGGEVILPAAFSFHPAPAMDLVLPNSSYAAGGLPIELRGRGFTENDAGTTELRFAGGPLPATVASDTQILFEVPPGAAAGPVDLEVVNQNGTTRLAEGFSYFGYPPVFAAADTRVDADIPGAASSSGARIATWGPHVYAIWQDNRFGAFDIRFRRSIDSGATWEADEVRLDSGLPGEADSYEPALTAEGELVAVVWEDSRNRGTGDIYFNRSADAGVTWLESDVRLDTDAPGSAPSRGARIVNHGKTLHVAWFDYRDGHADVYYQRSLDAGSTWLESDVRLDTDIAGAARSTQVELAVDGSNVYVVWKDERAGLADIYLRRSTDEGATWPEPEKQLETDGIGKSSAHAPQVAASGGAVHVVWTDFRDLSGDVYYRGSQDAGATWPEPERLVEDDAPGSAASFLPQVAAVDENVYVTWYDYRNGDADVFFRRSIDRGASWARSDVRLDTDEPGASYSAWPRIGTWGHAVFVVWVDRRNGEHDIYLNLSIDDGASWLPDDLRIDTDEPGSARSFDPFVTGESARIYVSWYDYRNGAADVYASRTLPF